MEGGGRALGRAPRASRRRALLRRSARAASGGARFSGARGPSGRGSSPAGASPGAAVAAALAPHAARHAMLIARALLAQRWRSGWWACGAGSREPSSSSCSGPRLGAGLVAFFRRGASMARRSSAGSGFGVFADLTASEASPAVGRFDISAGSLPRRLPRLRRFSRLGGISGRSVRVFGVSASGSSPPRRGSRPARPRCGSGRRRTSSIAGGTTLSATVSSAAVAIPAGLPALRARPPLARRPRFGLRRADRSRLGFEGVLARGFSRLAAVLPDSAVWTHASRLCLCERFAGQHEEICAGRLGAGASADGGLSLWFGRRFSAAAGRRPPAE